MPAQPPAPFPPDLRLGIVVVTSDRAPTLTATLERLTRLEAPYPIVVVDNASSDGTPVAVRDGFPGVAVIERAVNIGGVARNDGVRQLAREYVAFADDDSWWAPGSLAAAIALFDRHPRLALIMSRVLAGPEERLDPCCALMRRSPLPRPADAPGIPVLGFLGCGAIVRRAAFLAAGGFDERFGTGGEEAWVAMNLADAGWQLAYIEEIVSHHHPAPRTPGRMRQRRIEGVAADLWTVWTRRSWRDAARATLAHARRAATDGEARAGLLRALPDLPASLRRRRPLSARVEAQLRLLERQRAELG